MIEKSHKKFDKNCNLDYTYTAGEILFVFTSNILLAEELFKLYRITGDSILYRIKEFVLLEVLLLFLVRFERIWLLITVNVLSDKKGAHNKNKTLSSLSSKLYFLLGSE